MGARPPGRKLTPARAPRRRRPPRRGRVAPAPQAPETTGHFSFRPIAVALAIALAFGLGAWTAARPPAPPIPLPPPPIVEPPADCPAPTPLAAAPLPDAHHRRRRTTVAPPVARVLEAIRAHGDDLRACGELATSGRLLASVHVRPPGRIDDVAFRDRAPGGAGECVKRTMKTWVLDDLALRSELRVLVRISAEKP